MIKHKISEILARGLAFILIIIISPVIGIMFLRGWLYKRQAKGGIK